MGGFLVYKVNSNKNSDIGKNITNTNFGLIDILPILCYTNNSKFGGRNMKYLSVKEVALLWNTSERSVRNYCAAGRVPGAFLTGKTWNIPENAEKPERSNKSQPAPQTLLDILPIICYTNNSEFGGKVMKYLSVKEVALLWNTSERSVRNYCAAGRVPGAFLTGKTWNIPENAEKPERSNKSKPAPQTLLDILKEEKRGQVHGGIYHKIQIELTYNSNHIEGSRLTHDQTRYIFETNTIGITDEGVRVDDIIETSTHFRCIDEIIDNAKSQLSEKFIKHLHFILKTGTIDSKKDWFAVGDY